jgi:outer membrane lipoprotein carrier protein
MPSIRTCQRIGPCAVLLLLIGGAAALAGATARAAEGPASAYASAKRLEDRLAGVKGVEADFAQILDTPALPEPQVESGRLFLERPGKMRWEYSKPKGKLAVADGKDTWLWLPDDQVAIQAPFQGDERDSGVSLLMGERLDLSGRFSIDWAPGPKGEPHLLRLRPRTRGAPYDALLVQVDGSGFPSRIVVLDPLGGRVTYRFSSIKFLDRLDPSLFQFTPPPGATVQRATP